jgi:hypothetical protein
MKKLYSIIAILLITNIAIAQELTATQSFPSNVYPGKDFTIEVTINKAGLTGFMKFAQELPEGFVATVIESKGGSFTYADNSAKIVWINPPSESIFTISYKVSVPSTATGSVNLTGKISYILNNERKVCDLEKKYFVVGSNGIATPDKIPVATTTTTTPTTAVVTETKKEPTPEPKKEPVVTEVKKENVSEVKKEPTPVVIPPTVVTKAPTAATANPAGKIYKVQIGAYSAKPKLEGVPNMSTFVLDNGITKYFSGSFTNYDEAVKHKATMLERGFAGAFIVAFENGKIVK